MTELTDDDAPVTITVDEDDFKRACEECDDEWNNFRNSEFGRAFLQAFAEGFESDR